MTTGPRGTLDLPAVGPVAAHLRKHNVRQYVKRVHGRSFARGSPCAATAAGFPTGPFPANFLFSGVLRRGRNAAELRDDMTGKAIQDLVGRVMIDREFLAQLARDPDVILAGYELTAEERAVIMQALGRGAYVSEEERAHALQNVMLKRWAT
jgi:hypothetical protein